MDADAREGNARAEETALLARARAGDHEAFEKWISLYRRFIRYLAWKSELGEADQADIVQNVILRLLESPLLRPDNPLPSPGATLNYIHRATHHSILAWLNSPQTRRSAQLPNESLLSGPERRDNIDLLYLAKRVRERILLDFPKESDLPTLFDRRFRDGATLAEIAAEHKLPVSTVHYRLSRIRRLIEEVYSEISS